ncbi:MAG: hypothetical protein ABI035_12850 [Gemmatimonadaceae bacterium]
MPLKQFDLESVHKHSSRHREVLARSDSAGCFYCQSFFVPAEIMDWVDGRQAETGSASDGITALCPRCGIDAVLPSAAPIPLSADLLAQMHYYFFAK